MFLATPFKEMHLLLGKTAYSSESINRAAYKVAPMGCVVISEAGDSWDVILEPINGTDSVTFKHEFMTNLADEELRSVIRARTEPLRSLILAHAYSNTRLAQ